MDTAQPATVAAASPVVLNDTAAIRKYFFAPDAKALDILPEITALTPADKAELGAGARIELAKV